ncbi:glutamine--fructose-6-phosphate aminotransferase [Sulfolobales archaeon HS-7]|nr:glutamine--fructose-6-phosphate aminotransferase [Sulfolobales archaeon HS-7]
MCGIIGIVSKRDEKASLLLTCLSRLEYRGYDSAGVVVMGKEGMKVVKSVGSVENLSRKFNIDATKGNVLVGHTRWATHGGVTDYNAHPHLDCAGKIAVVHNGIIRNFKELREQLQSLGHNFNSETDTEVIPHMIEHFMKMGEREFDAFKKAVNLLQGTYSILAVIGDRIYFARKDSPLVIGLGEDKFFIASDISAFLQYTKRVIILQNGDIGYVSPGGIYIENGGREVDYVKATIQITWNAESASKEGFPHFMLKEIHESPLSVKETIEGLRSDIENVRNVTRLIESAKDVFLISAGTSYHASFLFSILLQREGKRALPVISSEWYNYPKADLVIAVSQSGETMDTLLAMRHFKELGSTTVSITNVMGSTISREAEYRLYMRAGPEISVAATKTFTSEIALFYFLKEMLYGDVNRLEGVHAVMEKSIQMEGYVKDIAKFLSLKENCYYLGRGLGVPLAMEGALKLKEIAYVHAEAYPAGESKHGPIALVEKGFPVIFIDDGEVINGERKSIILEGNVKEMEARGADPVIIGYNSSLSSRLSVNVLGEPGYGPFAISPLIQLLAYYTAVERKYNPDRPRNLAKTVTVE